MPFVSLTRLRLRSWRFLPAFLVHTGRSTRQMRASEGFLAGRLAIQRGGTFWTLTSWADEQSMRGYRNTGAHVKAMPKLLDWCDEAAIAHWEQSDFELPDGAEAMRRLVSQGRLSKVRHPSAAHAAGDLAPLRDPPNSASRFCRRCPTARRAAVERGWLEFMPAWLYGSATTICSRTRSNAP